MIGSQIQSASLVISAGAVAFALAVSLWAWRLTDGARTARAKWRDRAEGLEKKLDRIDGVLAAHPGVVLVWEDDEDDPESGWGAPKLYGSPTALAALLRFADASDGPDASSRMLDGLADYDARDSAGADTTLRKRLIELRRDGAPFSITIFGPSGRYLEVDGRPSGRRAVLWLSDSTVKSAEESSERGRLLEARLDVAQDPMSFVDLASKAPFPVWRYSSGLKVQWANQAYLDAIEVKTLDVAVADDIALDPGAKEQARQALAQGALVNETRPIVAAGARKHYAISMFPISGGVAGVAVDMTRAEEAREALERHVRAQDDALNHLDDAVVVFGPNQQLSFYNRAFPKLFGLDEAWLAHRPTHGEMLDRMREKRLLPEQPDYQTWKAEELGRYTHLDPDDAEETWHLPDDRILRVARLRHPLGGLLLIFGDMTEELTLKSQFNTLIKVQRATLDKLNEGVAVFGPDGRLKLSNAAFAEMWSLGADKIREGVSFDDVAEWCLPLFHKRDEWAEMKARVTDPNPRARKHHVGEMRRSDDTVLAYVSRPLPDGATVLAFHDVTASRDLEGALKERAEVLEQADRVKSDFVGHVSYQLRAPLTTIMGYAELLDATVAEKLSERENSQLTSIIQAGTQLTKLVEDILDVAAIDAETLELDLAEFDVFSALESAVNLAKTKAGDTQVRVGIECAADLGPMVGDQRRIKQVVYNLLLNALDHTPAGRNVVAGADRDDEVVRVWIDDEGEGIAPEKQGRVFEAFQSGDSGGAGLGLTLVRELVKLHDGWVELESEPGVGTRVTCHLPVISLPKGDAPEKREASVDAAAALSADASGGA